MTTDSEKIRKRILDPNERIAEVLFGLIMVLTFTGSLSVSEAGRDDVRTMLIGALGCNLAWGIIDAILYLMACMAARGQGLKAFRAVRAAEPREGQQLIAAELPPVIANLLESAELESMRLRLIELPEPPDHTRLRKRDWLGGLGVFLLVFISTFPVAIPFMVMQSATPAARTSNAIALAMLFLLGFAFGRCSARNPWVMGGAMVALGVVLVGMTIALGG